MVTVEAKLEAKRIISEISDDTDLTYEMLALLEVVDFDYERWCDVVDLNPREKSSYDQWTVLHAAYMDWWKENGNEDFFAEIDWRASRWSSLLSSRKRS